MILRIKRPFFSPYTAMPCLSFDTKRSLGESPKSLILESYSSLTVITQMTKEIVADYFIWKVGFHHNIEICSLIAEQGVGEAAVQ